MSWGGCVAVWLGELYAAVAECLRRRHIQSSCSACMLFTWAVGTFRKAAGNDSKSNSLFGDTKEILKL